MKDKGFAELKGSLTEVLAHARGKVTLKTRDVPLPAPVEQIKPVEIVRLRQKLNASQGVFARMLNVSRDTEISWETGRRKPSGAALRLLQIIQVVLSSERLIVGRLVPWRRKQSADEARLDEWDW